MTFTIEDLREQGQIKDLPYVQEEKDNLINIVGNVVGEVEVIERENKNGEAFKVTNFSVVSGGIRYIIIARLMEKRVIFQRILKEEILLSFLDKSEPILMITARNIAISGYFLQSY